MAQKSSNSAAGRKAKIDGDVKPFVYQKACDLFESAKGMS